MTSRDRHALVLGSSAVAVAVLLLRLGPWAWHGVTQAKEELQGKAERLAYMRAQVASARSLEDSGAVVRAGMARLAPSLLSGSTANEAVADLGTHLNVVVERARVGVRRTDPVPDSTSAGLARRVSLRASIEGDTRGLLGLLGALAEGPQLVSVHQIQVAADAVADPVRPELLHAELTVSGWYLPSATRR